VRSRAEWPQEPTPPNAQEPAPDKPVAPAPLAAEPEKKADRWEVSVDCFGYRVSDDDDYASTAVKLDRGPLHLEARYIYEDIDTGSVFVGWNFDVSDEITCELTPMIGVVFGDTDGIAPGLEATIGAGRFELYTEIEYVIATDDDGDDFTYSWTELAWSPNERFRAGIVAQRTRAYDTDVDIQRGCFVGAMLQRIGVTAYVFEPFDDDRTWVVSFGFGI
jgi:hypothetical protein